MITLDLPDIPATEKLAQKLASSLAPGITIYLHGNLGAGKTTLVRAILQSLGHSGAIKSPTYTLVESYSVNNLDIYHFDLYRLADPSELEFIGIRDYASSKGICLFEWPSKGMGNIPLADLEITLDFAEIGRKISLLANTPNGSEILKSLDYVK